MIFIEADETFRDLIPDDLLREAALKALQLDRLEELPSISVKITDDQTIQELNANYRGIDNSTDVLSFEADYYDPDLESIYLGDVVISYPYAAAQAEKRGHPIDSELQLLVIHGVLHLMGYDHGLERDKEVMWLKQEMVLKELGLKIKVEDEGEY